MRIIIFLSVLSSLIILSGCATSPTTSSNTRPIAPQRITRAPVALHTDTAAQVTIVRDSGGLGSAISAALRLNGAPVASFRTRESMTFTLDPGDYVFGLEPSPNLGAGLREYSFTAKTGEDYFYRISVTSEGFILQRSYEISK